MLLLIGLAILAAGIVLGQPFTTIGAAIAIACAVGLVLTQGRGKKGIVGKAVGGLASLYDITSYISDLLSYSRLLALGLTTGVMAQVFNMLATMMGGTVVGFIVAMLVPYEIIMNYVWVISGWVGLGVTVIMIVRVIFDRIKSGKN